MLVWLIKHAFHPQKKVALTLDKLSAKHKENLGATKKGKAQNKEECKLHKIDQFCPMSATILVHCKNASPSPTLKFVSRVSDGVFDLATVGVDLRPEEGLRGGEVHGEVLERLAQIQVFEESCHFTRVVWQFRGRGQGSFAYSLSEGESG